MRACRNRSLRICFFPLSNTLPPGGSLATMRVSNPTVRRREIETRFTLRNSDELDARSFDYIVVGAGASGCALCASLLRAEASLTVLLLETGVEGQHSPAVTVPCRAFGLWRSELDWGVRSTAQSSLLPRGRRMELEQGRTLGGSTALNYTVWARGQRGDFEAWVDEHGCAGWGWGEMEPCFSAAERALFPAARTSRDARLRMVPTPPLPEVAAFLAAADQCGMRCAEDVNAPALSGEARAGATQCSSDYASATRLDAFTAFVEPLLRRESDAHGRLTVYSSATVTELLKSDEGQATGDVVVGVTVASADGSVARCTATREVILCAGALATPLLLMRAGFGPRAELARHCIACCVDSPNVGVGLQDHGVCPVTFRLKTARKIALGSCGIPGIAFLRSATDERRAQRLYGDENDDATGVRRSGARDGSTDTQLVFTSRGTADGAPKQYLQRVERSSPLLVGVKSNWLLDPLRRAAIALGRRERSRAARGDGYTDAASIDTVLNRPQSRGTVRLRSSAPDDLPLVDGRWLSSRDDVRTQIEGLRTIGALMRTKAMREIVAEVIAPLGLVDASATDAALEKYVRTQQQSTWHYSCTAAMGGESSAVCTPRGIVRGVSGLRVCDCSLMPFVVSGNTQATAMAIGIRIAAMVLEERGGEETTSRLLEGVRSKL